jgi:hypothetical protein
MINHRYSVRFKTLADPDGKDVHLDVMPNKNVALQSLNANEAKTKLGGKQFAFDDAENIGDWFLIEDGNPIPLKEAT